MTPLLGKPLSDYIFVDPADAEAVAKAEEDLRQTAITQPAVLATDLALTRLLGRLWHPARHDHGHSLGEYGALVAAGALPFDDALEAVSARGREMTRVSMEDNGRMAAVFAPLAGDRAHLEDRRRLRGHRQCQQRQPGGDRRREPAVEQAMEAFLKAGYNVVPLPVSHAFHTSIVAPASEPLRRVLERLRLQSPRVPIVANVNGEFYPTGPDVVPRMLDILARQVASPVQFVKGLRTLYDAGARVFVEVGPEESAAGICRGCPRRAAATCSRCSPIIRSSSDIAAFNQALCGLYAAGLGAAADASQFAAPRMPS